MESFMERLIFVFPVSTNGDILFYEVLESGVITSRIVEVTGDVEEFVKSIRKVLLEKGKEEGNGEKKIREENLFFVVKEKRNEKGEIISQDVFFIASEKVSVFSVGAVKVWNYLRRALSETLESETLNGSGSGEGEGARRREQGKEGEGDQERGREEGQERGQKEEQREKQRGKEKERVEGKRRNGDVSERQRPSEKQLGYLKRLLSNAGFSKEIAKELCEIVGRKDAGRLIDLLKSGKSSEVSRLISEILASARPIEAENGSGEDEFADDLPF